MASTSATAPQGARPRLRLLDGLRFIAALSVVIYHFTARTNPAWGVETYDLFPVMGRFTAYGSMGVELFFVISGFVIMLSAEGRSIRSFAVSRITRLYPAYWAGVLLTGGLLFFTGWVTPSGSWSSMHLRGVLLNLTMLHPAWNVPSADGVYWTLWIELLFYAFVGLLLLSGGVTRRRMLMLAVGWPLVGALCNVIGLGQVGAFLQPQYAPFFGVGICLFLIHREGWRMSTVLSLGFVVVFALYQAGSYMPGWIVAWTPLAPGATGTMLMAALIIAVVSAVVLVPQLQGVNWRWLSVLGSLTYPLYVIHDIWGWWLISQIRHVLPTWLTLVAAILLVIAMAAGIHYWVERPVAAALKRWADRDARLSDGERATGLSLPQRRGRAPRSARKQIRPEVARVPETSL